MERPCDWVIQQFVVQLLSLVDFSRHSEQVHGGLHDDWIPHTPIYILPGEDSDFHGTRAGQSLS